MAGQSTTCGVCGEKIETPAKPLFVDANGKGQGSLIDLDAHWNDYTQHYEQKHPETAIPPRLW